MTTLADQIKRALATYRTLVVDSENRPRRGRFLPDSPPHGCSMGQEAGKKGVGAVDLQPTIPMSDRLLGALSFADIGELSGRRAMHAALNPNQVPVPVPNAVPNPQTSQKWIALGVGATLPTHVMVYVIGACRRMQANLLLVSRDPMQVCELLADYLPELDGIYCETEALTKDGTASVITALNLHHGLLFAISGTEDDPLRPLLRARRGQRSPVPIVLVTRKTAEKPVVKRLNAART